MSDPLDPLAKQPVGAKPTPSGGFGQNDVLLIGGGTAAVVGTQLLSKTYPHLAQHVFSNVVGGGRLVAAESLKPKVNATIGLFGLPAPFGYIDPVNYDLSPNYLAEINYRLEQRNFVPSWFRLPESAILKTQRDTHPDVKAGEYRLEGVRQIRRIRDFAARASVEEVTDLYRFAASPEGQKYIFYPGEVLEDLGISVRAKVGIEPGNELLHGANSAKLLGAVTPAPYEGGDYGAADPLTQIGAALGNQPRPVIRAVLDVLGLDPVDQVQPAQVQPVAADPLDASEHTRSTIRAVVGQSDPLTAPPTRRADKPGPPSSALQQEAFARAPKYLKELASERADP